MATVTAPQQQQQQQQIGVIIGVPQQQQPQLNILVQRVPGGATEILYKGMRFLITERPNDLGMLNYLEELKKFNVSVVVRVCEPTYSTNKLLENNIQVKDLSFPDGQPPPQTVIDGWLELVRNQFITTTPPPPPPPTESNCVAVHCVAGLGRAPVLVAVALMELGMKYEDAVELIRGKRRGAINAKQLSFLERYKPKSRLKKHHNMIINNNNNNNNCIVM